MSSTNDLDRLITSWLRDGATAASDATIERALAETEGVRQRRRSGVGVFGGVVWPDLSLHLAALALVLALVVVTTAIGIGTGIIPAPRPDRGADEPRTQTPSIEPSGELQEFTNAEDGYELLLPAAWASAPEEVEFRDGQAATTFGQGRGAGTRARPALTIIVGNPDGSITPCLICHQVVITSLDELEEAVESTPSFLTGGPPERHVDVSLGEQPARSESAGIGSSCLGCPGAYHHVYAIRNGRPYVLAFDYWTVRFESLALPDGSEEIFPPSTLEAILDSFVFLDEADSTTSPPPSDHASPDGATFAAPDGTFEIALPIGWELGTGPDPGTLYLTSRYPSLTLSIRAADAEGEIRMCDSPAGPWESCPTVEPTTLAELADGIGLDGTEQDVWTGPIPYDSELDAEPAVSSYLTGGVSPPTSVKYVVAMHGGRPFVIRAVQRRSPDNIANLEDLLRGFRFVDASAAESVAGSQHTYALTIPDGWIGGATTLPGVRTYRIHEDDREWPGMNVSVESDDGVLDLCVIRCASFTGIDTIEDIAAAIRDESVLSEPIESPYGPVQPKPTWWFDRDRTTLDGEEAWIEQPVISTGLPGEGQFEHVFAVHDGRAAILSFDFRSVWARRISEETIADILESFEFAD